MPLAWKRGLYDLVLHKAALWQAKWPQGKPAADQDYFDPAQGMIKVVTRRYVEIPWTDKEFAALLEILEDRKEYFTSKGTYEFVLDLQNFYKSFWAKCRLLPGGLRLVGLVAYKEDTEDIVSAIRQVRDRVPEKPRGMEVNDDFWG